MNVRTATEAFHGPLGPFTREDVVSDPPWRTLQALAFARVLVAAAVMLALAIFGNSLLPRHAGEPAGMVLTAGGVFYLLLSIGLSVLSLYARRRFMFQLGAQLAVDMVAVSIFVLLAGGATSVVAVLYLLPLAGASLLLPTVATYFVCALAVIVLLADAVIRGLQADMRESLLLPAGIFGAALFAMTALLSFLSSRLASQERLARQRGRNLENQLEINRLVIAQMDQGVIVVDARTQVRANNRSARRLLGLPVDTQFTGRLLTELPGLTGLSQAFSVWMDAERDDLSLAGGTLPMGRPATTHTMSEPGVRARFARPSAPGSAEFVIFLEDVRALDQKAQQLKLAAMGRLTASIAHEIRNPLAAISHAGQLLEEEALEPLQQRLAGIVRENTRRLNGLVEDVLRVARREPPQGDEFDLGDFASGWLEEFQRDRNVADGIITLDVQPGLSVKFERSHLRQVVFNLVDNALRHASGGPASVTLKADRSMESGGSIRLWVLDNGPGVAQDVRSALFEPFYTTHARGTGLGLYLAREFCIANRADLQYEALIVADGSQREGFVVRFGRSAGGRTEEHGFLDTMPAQ